MVIPIGANALGQWSNDEIMRLQRNSLIATKFNLVSTYINAADKA